MIGVSFDGTGFGEDGNIWGGEFFTGTLKGLKRAAHFDYARMPGMDMAVKEPWRMALSYLYQVYGKDAQARGRELIPGYDMSRSGAMLEMIERGISSPFTSSAGRLFDAVASKVFVLCCSLVFSWF